MTIIAAADGSALGNPGPAGWAWYVDEGCWAAGGWPESTNNRGELTAVLELLRATAGAGEDLLVQADSQYVINSLTRWMKGWKRRGWRKADGAKKVVAVVLALILVLAALGGVLHFSSTIGRHMSLTLRTIMTRLMGMILAAIAVGMLAAGLSQLFPGLSG